MSEHTPGPWGPVEGCSEGGAYEITLGIGSVATVWGDCEESRANATLMAAAPELLEALKILRVQVGDYRDGDGAAKFHACNIADAAIARAQR